MLDFYIMPQGNEVEPHLGQSKSRQGQLLFSCQGALAAAFWAVLLCGSGTGPDIDLLSYMTTRRFVFPQMGYENGGKLLRVGQRFGKFFFLMVGRGVRSTRWMVFVDEGLRPPTGGNGSIFELYQWRVSGGTLH